MNRGLANPAAPPSVSFWQAFAFWLKLGCISFGGPAGQISMMHAELVERRRWISERRFLHALNYCMLLPGPEAQQLATYIGWLMHRTPGGVVAGTLFVLPSLLLLIGLSWVYITFGETPLVAGLFYGIKPAVTAIVVQAAHRIGMRALKNPFLWAIAAASFVAIFALAAPFPVIVAVAALLGYIGGRVAPEKFQLGGGHGPAEAAFGPALIDDDTPTPEHARFGWNRLIRVLIVAALLWAIPMGLLIATHGWQHTLTQMSWFFTKAALLTFGGAYAVLPYVYQGAVEHYGWLTATQMIDGLALGETTPGPLIMVVAFVGFVGGYLKAVFGPDSLFLAGSVAASLVTWFTFLPSFVFILLGGPLVETTHNQLKFTAPLTAITAAVVGVILNLALFFGYHVLWPRGFAGSFDWISALIALGAAVALFYYRQNVIAVIAAGAVVGLLVEMLMLS
ncbi:MAG: chromate efflux transporter [Candidatus Accumulibacter sp.]|uniref:Chromate efflux transporter n=5 Tax=Candidatus Accumulibacter TaxID=327159 RepID=A0A7D5NH21_9PROT|nr:MULTISPECIES: chromate efflux transporter [Candidatus Accumulibacter]QLH51929.1 MAG: chromate efflux transporter [Candidatus Accumulibacter cognatus]MBN8518446.1 chromate efflux transporter [Accumulibacter sp.]MBO3710742.1 chromate efflux transporter [Accumulibacter sp.]MCM8581240.1 chromate efflux transporter [Accumulibacter sp.]TMQ77530.1 Chromate transport protein ChrA [Candidatus Accumulibacter phosphatis]